MHVTMKNNRWFEKLLIHYLDIISFSSFDYDTKLAYICSEKDFQPLRLETFLLCLPVRLLLTVFSLFSERGLIAWQNSVKMSVELLRPLVFAVSVLGRTSVCLVTMI